MFSRTISVKFGLMGIALLLLGGCNFMHRGGPNPLWVMTPAQARIEIPSPEACAACPPLSSCGACGPITVDATDANWLTTASTVLTALIGVVVARGWP